MVTGKRLLQVLSDWERLRFHYPESLNIVDGIVVVGVVYQRLPNISFHL